jgi:DNA-binding CsgD family transcriptional regulator
MTTELVLTRKEENDIWKIYIERRIQRNQNVLIAITGQTGSGKSYSAIKICELMSKQLGTTFTVDNICFEPTEFMQLINSDKLSKGSCLILDETGVAINSRKWQSKTNILIGYVTQTFRHKNYIVIFNVPDFSFIDSALRKMFHIYIETNGINYQEKLCCLKPFLLQTNQRTGNLYYKYLRYKVPDKEVTTCDGWDLSLPSKELIKEYENKKTMYTKKLNEGVQKELEGIDNKANQDIETQPLTEVQQKIYDYKMQGMKQVEIQKILNTTSQHISNACTQIRKKGYHMLK